MRSRDAVRAVLSTIVILMASSYVWAETVIEAVRARQPPMLDGWLDNAVWKEAKPVTHFLLNNTNMPAPCQTTAYVLYDDTDLYIGFKCDEPNIKDIVSKEVPHDGDVWSSDCVEIMLGPRQDKNNYFHITVNVANSTADRSCTQAGYVGDMTWESHLRSATFIGKNYWSCEVAIPYYALGIAPGVGSTWDINLCREKKKPSMDSSSISELGAFNNAGRFVTLKGLNVDFSRYCFQVGAPKAETRVEAGKLQVSLSAPIRNLTGKAQQVLVDAILTDPLKKSYDSTRPASLDAGQEATVRFEPILVSERGEYQCALRVATADTQRALSLSQTSLALDFVPMAIRLIEPWYRDCIFESQKLEKVIAEVPIRLDEKQLATSALTVSIFKKGEKEPVDAQTVDRPQAVNRVEFLNAKLPYGDMVMVAALAGADGKPLEQVSYPLRKLPYHKGEAWVGRDRIWWVDGKPFFMNGAWCEAQDINEYYNAFSYWPGFPGVWPESCKKILMFWIPRSEFTADKISDALAQQLRKQVADFLNDPNMFMYYLSDEPEGGGCSVKGLKSGYDLLRELDPWHPVFISDDSIDGLRTFADCAEMNGLHPYPVILRDKRVNDFSPIVTFMDTWQEFCRDGICRQTIAFLAAGFNYGDVNQVNVRVPTYVELRDQYLLALTLGSAGVMQYTESVQEHYPELRIGIPLLAKELLYLGQTAIIAPDSKLPVKASHASARTLLKEASGELYLFVSNADMTPRKLTITIPGMNRDGRPLRVISEDRIVTPKGDAFTDRFDTFETHVYTTSTQKTNLLTVKEICDRIDRANAARRKPGNLLFQVQEGDGVIVRVSSNLAAQNGRADACLWHLVDGVVDTVEGEGADLLVWKTATPNEIPAWVEIQMPKAHTVGRVVVYPYHQSLKDYSVQAYVNGAWKDVDKVAGKKADMITHTFAPVTTDRIRIWITADNGPTSAITEIEAYEK